MDKRSSKKRPSDLNQLAAVEEATQEKLVEEQEPQGLLQQTEGKNPAAVALGRLGGKKGGKARAMKLSAERRREIAQQAANVRWARRSNG